MKKMIVLALVLVLVSGVAVADLYPQTAKVIALEYDEDVVVVETFTGFQFAFYGCEEWAEGDCASLIMDDCGTAEIADDVVLMAQYSAWDLVNWME